MIIYQIPGTGIGVLQLEKRGKGGGGMMDEGWNMVSAEVFVRLSTAAPLEQQILESSQKR
jgi:hypothetical protein